MNFFSRTEKRRDQWAVVLNPPPPSPPLPAEASSTQAVPNAGHGQQRPPVHYQSPTAIPNGPLQSVPTSRYASLSLHHTDRLRCFQFSTEDIGTIRDAINQSAFGVQLSERSYYGCHEIQLRGTPWTPGTGWDTKHSSCLLICYIFANLYNFGWVIRAATRTGCQPVDKDNFLFRYQHPPPPLAEWFCIAFTTGDRLRLIGAPLDLKKPIADMLGPLLQRQETNRSGYEFQCRGYPWLATSGPEVVAAKLVLLRLMEVLEMNGVVVYASAENSNVINEDDNAPIPVYSDTWYCCRQVGWTPGMPLLH